MSDVEQVVVSLASRCARLAIELQDVKCKLSLAESKLKSVEAYEEQKWSERYEKVREELEVARSANQALAGANSRFLAEINTMRQQAQDQNGAE